MADAPLFSIAVSGEQASEEAVAAVRRLRAEYIPEAFAGVPGEVLVTGWTAFNIDFFDIADRFTPIVFALVLGLSFVLLTVFFRSIVISAKAIVMNLLSVGAAYGLMVLVFQKGVGADLLGFQQSETIDAWIPLFLFSMLFGLSMDWAPALNLSKRRCCGIRIRCSSPIRGALLLEWGSPEGASPSGGVWGGAPVLSRVREGCNPSYSISGRVGGTTRNLLFLDPK